MISAGFDDYKKDSLCKVERVLCKEDVCEECPAIKVCGHKEEEKEIKGEK